MPLYFLRATPADRSAEYTFRWRGFSVTRVLVSIITPTYRWRGLRFMCVCVRIYIVILIILSLNATRVSLIPGFTLVTLLLYRVHSRTRNNINV